MPQIETLVANEMTPKEQAEKALEMCEDVQKGLLARLRGESTPNLHDIYHQATALHITLQFLAGKR